MTIADRSVLDADLVEGPATSTDNDLVRYNGTSGKLIKAGGKIANSDLASVATSTLKGRVAAGSGTPSDLTVAQVRTLIGQPEIVLQRSTIASGGTSIVLNNLGNYRFIEARGWIAPISAGAPIGLRMSTDGGATWISTSTSYRRMGIGVYGTNAPGNIGADDSYFYLNSMANQVSGEASHFSFSLNNNAGSRIGILNTIRGAGSGDGARMQTFSSCDTAFNGPIGAIQLSTPGATFACDIIFKAWNE